MPTYIIATRTGDGLDLSPPMIHIAYAEEPKVAAHRYAAHIEKCVNEALADDWAKDPKRAKQGVAPVMAFGVSDWEEDADGEWTAHVYSLDNDTNRESIYIRIRALPNGIRVGSDL